jgi:hypothetical protein
MYKTINNIALSKFNIFLNNTRNNEIYFIPYVRTNYGKFSLIYQGPNVWNNLPQDIRNANSLSIFKNMLRNSYLEAY